MSEKEEYNVIVLSRETVVTYPKLNEAVHQILITYVAAGLPPATIEMLQSEWNEEQEKKQVRASIEARLKRKPQTYRV